MRTVPLVIFFLVLGVSACAQRDDGLPEAVTTALAAIAAECSDVGGTPHTQNAVRGVDLNGDAAADFVLYTGWAVCENAVSIYGDREKSLAVYVAESAGGVHAAFADAVYDATIEETASGARLWLTTSGAQCGRPPAATFAEEAFCARAIVWDAARALFEYAPVASVRMIE